MTPVKLTGAAFWAFMAGEDRMTWRYWLMEARKSKGAVRTYSRQMCRLFRSSYRRNLQRALQ